MWDKLRKTHPRLYEAVEWGVFWLSVLAFLLALSLYLEAKGAI